MFRTGNFLIGHHTINLSTGDIERTSTSFYPYSRFDLCQLSDGGVVGIDGLESSLMMASRLGVVSTIDDLSNWEKVISDGVYCWVYGTGGLKRVDLSNGSLGATNYLEGTDMLQVTNMAVTSDNKIRIDGTASNGNSVIIYTDRDTGEVEVSTVSFPRFVSVIPLN